jgi:hypothetical protein
MVSINQQDPRKKLKRLSRTPEVSQAKKQYEQNVFIYIMNV